MMGRVSLNKGRSSSQNVYLKSRDEEKPPIESKRIIVPKFIPFYQVVIYLSVDAVPNLAILYNFYFYKPPFSYITNINASKTRNQHFESKTFITRH
jgi:hypothetical protein